MSTGGKMLAWATLFVVVNTLLALYFRRTADRVETGELVMEKADPQRIRQAAMILLVSGPLLWILFALIAFGAVPTGIDTIKF